MNKLLLIPLLSLTLLSGCSCSIQSTSTSNEGQVKKRLVCDNISSPWADKVYQWNNRTWMWEIDGHQFWVTPAYDEICSIDVRQVQPSTTIDH